MNSGISAGAGSSSKIDSSGSIKSSLTVSSPIGRLDGGSAFRPGAFPIKGALTTLSIGKCQIVANSSVLKIPICLPALPSLLT